jgi:signal peptidase I
MSEQLKPIDQAPLAVSAVATAPGAIAHTSSLDAHRPSARPAESHGVLHAVQSLLYIIVVATFIITFAIQPFRIPSESMEPTLLVGDFLLVAKQPIPSPPGSGESWIFPSTAIHRGDVIVFHYPIDPSIHLVKRVIGMPGDQLRLRNGRVFIDGHPLIEPYAVYSDSVPDNFRDNFPRLQNPDPDVTANWWIQMKSLVNRGELTVPPHSYFVLGDNRNDSEDSRYWGFVPASSIVGKPLLIYFSLNEPSRDDDPPTPRVSALPLHTPRQTTTTLNQIAGFARWDRTLRVIR